MTAFRSLSVGSDTPKYYALFEEIYKTSWAELGNRFVERYILWEGHIEIGYYVVAKVFQVFSTDYRLWSAFVTLMFMIPLCKILLRYLDSMSELLLAFVIYGALFMGTSYTCNRQFLADTCSFWAFLYLMDGKRIKAILLVLLGFFMHTSCLLFLLFIGLSFVNSRVKKILHFVAMGLIPFVIVFSGEIIRYMGNMARDEQYVGYGQNVESYVAVSFTIMMGAFSLLLLFLIKIDDLENDKMLSFVYTAVPIFTFFAPLTTNNGSMVRISFYFHIYLLVLLPIVLNRSFKGVKLAYILTMIALAALSFVASGAYEYVPFWDDPYKYVIM